MGPFNNICSWSKSFHCSGYGNLQVKMVGAATYFCKNGTSQQNATILGRCCGSKNPTFFAV
jgi:hypothetical protein